MKQRGGIRNQTALSFEQDLCDAPKAKIFHALGANTETVFQQYNKGVTESPEDRRLKQLEAENKRLAALVEDLKQDKLFQSRRLKELYQEKNQLMKKLADMMVNIQNLTLPAG